MDKTVTASAVYDVTDVLVQGSGTTGLCAIWGSFSDWLSETLLRKMLTVGWWQCLMTSRVVVHIQ